MEGHTVSVTAQYTRHGYLDVDFAVPPRVSMKFVGAKANEKDDSTRDMDELKIACK
jgi:hypothetical protein